MNVSRTPGISRRAHGHLHEGPDTARRLLLTKLALPVLALLLSASPALAQGRSYAGAYPGTPITVAAETLTGSSTFLLPASAAVHRLLAVVPATNTASFTAELNIGASLRNNPQPGVTFVATGGSLISNILLTGTTPGCPLQYATPLSVSATQIRWSLLFGRVCSTAPTIDVVFTNGGNFVDIGGAAGIVQTGPVNMELWFLDSQTQSPFPPDAGREQFAFLNSAYATSATVAATTATLDPASKYLSFVVGGPGGDTRLADNGASVTLAYNNTYFDWAAGRGAPFDPNSAYAGGTKGFFQVTFKPVGRDFTGFASSGGLTIDGHPAAGTATAWSWSLSNADSSAAGAGVTKAIVSTVDGVTQQAAGSFTADVAYYSGTCGAPGAASCTGTLKSTVLAPTVYTTWSYGACSLLSPTVSNNGPVCPGSPVQLLAAPNLSVPSAGATYVWAWTGPNGWTSNLQNPIISAATAASAGTYFVSYSDGVCTSPQGATVVAVRSAPIVGPASLPGGTVGTPYNQTITATDGSGGYSFYVTSGTRPAGLTLNASTGVLSGTPTTAGTFTFSVTATDSTGCTGSKSYTIVIATTPQTLTIAGAGNGQGTVVGTSINCEVNAGSTSGPCSASYSMGTTLTLNAIPLSPSSFTSWSGNCVGSGSTCQLTMNQTQTVTVTFTAPGSQTLTVTKAGTGSGTVTSSPAGIDCGTACSSPFAYGVSVTLTAQASSPSMFAGWSGEGCSGTGSCTVTTSQLRNVTATFNLPGCSPPGSPVNVTIAPKSPAYAGAPPTGTDTLVLSWQAAAGQTAPVRYGYWLNGAAATSTTSTSAEAGAQKSAGVVQLYVQAFACTPEQGSGVATSGPVSLGAPAASFSMPATGVLGVPVTLTDRSSPQGTSWLWVFADGAPPDTNHLQSHSFAASGPQEVALLVSNGSGTSMAKQTINITGAVATPPAAENVRMFDPSGEGRLSIAGASIGTGTRSWLQVASEVAEGATVYLRFLDQEGALVLERRLELGPLSSGKCDLGAYGLKGKFRLEVVSALPVTAWLVEERLVEEPMPLRHSRPR